MSSKIFGNSFLKNSILEFWSWGADLFFLGQFWVIKVSSFEIPKPDSVGVNGMKPKLLNNPVFKFAFIVQHSEHSNNKSVFIGNFFNRKINYYLSYILALSKLCRVF